MSKKSIARKLREEITNDCLNAQDRVRLVTRLQNGDITSSTPLTPDEIQNLLAACEALVLATQEECEYLRSLLTA